MKVNADFYCDVVRRLRKNVPRKKPQNWQNKNIIIHHDNAPALRSFNDSPFSAKNNMTMVPHPLYSPDLAPCDFLLFPNLKLRMKGRRFETIEEIQEEYQRVLGTVPKRDFQGCFQAWQERWDRCILC
jgi:transposase